MIETDNAKFKIDVIAKIKEKTTGEVFTDDVRLIARGHYKSWWEDPTDMGLGEVNFVEQEIDPDTIQLDFNNGIELIEILSMIDDCDWRVDEKSLDDTRNS